MGDSYHDIIVGPKYGHFQPYCCIHVVFMTEFLQHILLLCIEGHLASAILLDPKYQTFSARTMGDIVTILLSDSNIEHFEPYRCIGVRLGCQLSDHISLVLRWGVNN